MSSRYSIGIDLGTTNCALSFVDLSLAGAESQTFAIPQLEVLNTVVDRTSLPSFLYCSRDATELEKGDWLAGLFARSRGGDTPDRVVHSAKSWLCHHSVSVDSRILPWNSTVIANSEKLSPIEASSRLLLHIREAWESRFGDVAPFSEQVVTVTVPASFDAAAQAATLEAARRAGYPQQVRLLEEPQAAFYRWLELENPGGKDATLTVGETVLVVDVGGGTSDFSFFKVEETRASGLPRFKRLDVSDHLLLGGDNIDLALAHALESELAPDGGELSVDQWGYLISRSRDLKERCLAQAEDEDVQVLVSLPSKGSGLFAGALSTEVSSLQARELLLEGFFPDCPASAKPERMEAGLLEWGLPYAADCAVTRHLAAFLDGKGKVDRVLFNGGTLSPQLLQSRLVGQIGNWQGGVSPKVLQNPETDLAVARGAAFYGASQFRGQSVIEAGAARSIYLEVDSEQGAKWVCVLPRGARAGDRFELKLDGLQLRLNRRARFQVYQAPDRIVGREGEVLDGAVDDTFRTLPVLEAEIEGDAEGGSESRIPVRIVASVNELGLLTVSCQEMDGEAVWPLSFNLRGESAELKQVAAPNSEILETSISPEKTVKAKRFLLGRLRAAEKASRIFKELEKQVRLPKHEWDLVFSRNLAAGCLDCREVLDRGGDAAESWLQLTGYLMRPGFGAPADGEKIEKLYASLDRLPRLTPQVEVQQLILYRRIAAGLEESQQAALFDAQLGRLRNSQRARAERIRLLGGLEKIDLERKEQLFEAFSGFLEKGISEQVHLASILAGLTGLVSRYLFHAGPDRVLPPDCVQSIYSTLKREDWKDGRLSGVIPLFLAAARLVDDRRLDVPSRLGGKIVRKLEKAGVAPGRLLPLQECVPIGREELVSSFGESLPPGLVLEEV